MAAVSKGTGARKKSTPLQKSTLRKNSKAISTAMPLPSKLGPMLATLVDEPFDKPGWIYEVKWDGYRALAFVDNGKVELRSRNDKSFNEKFYPVHNALSKLKLRAVLDGEVIVADANGHAHFGNLQNWRSEADGDLRFYVFDLLWLDGVSLLEQPLSERRGLLQKILPKKNDAIFLSEDFNASGTDFFGMAKAMNIEGIIAKKADSEYVPGARSTDWLKIKTATRQEVVIGGYTSNQGSAKVFSSLLVGVMQKGKLQYTGKIGTGFTHKMQQEMMKQFKSLERKISPFAETPDINKPSRFRPNPPKAVATWLKPTLICEVSYREITADGVMRHPSFEGMRIDKDAKDVVLEKAHNVKTNNIKTHKVKKPHGAGVAAGNPSENDKPTGGTARATRKLTQSLNSLTASSKKATSKKTTPNKTTTNKTTTNKTTVNKTTTQKSTPKKSASSLFTLTTKSRATLLNPTDERQTRTVNSKDISFTNLSKIYWPKEKYTKRDLMNYYYQVAPYILPYLKDRPQSLNRHPNGIDGKSFYQKDVMGKAPEWIRTFPYHSEADQRDKEYLVCTDEASLLYMASLGTIEMNPWSSRVQQPDNPDWCIIDLDPDKNNFNQVIETARVTHDVLEQLKVPSYCKTSGSTGLHIYIPLGAKYDYEMSREFARVIVTLVHQQLPGFTSIERPTAKRRGKIYLDFLQNRPQATLAAPYSARPKPAAPVSMPLDWTEVKKGLTIEQFNITNTIDRIRKNGDLFKPVLGKGIDLKKIIQQLE